MNLRWKRRWFRGPQRELRPLVARKVGDRTVVFPLARIDRPVRDDETVVWM